jgi:hypothetical protein
MLTTRILVNGFDGQTEGYGVSSGFGSIPSGHVVMVRGVGYLSASSRLPREIGVYIDGRGQNPSSGLVSDVLLEKRWGVVDDVWNNHVGADLVPLNPVLVIPGASLTVYMYKEAVGEVRMVAVLAYEYEKVTDEVVVSVRRRGGAAEVF